MLYVHRLHIAKKQQRVEIIFHSFSTKISIAIAAAAAVPLPYNVQLMSAMV